MPLAALFTAICLTAVSLNLLKEEIMIKKSVMGVFLASGIITVVQAATLKDTAILSGAVTSGQITSAKLSAIPSAIHDVASSGATNTAASTCPKGTEISAEKISAGAVSGGVVSGGEVPTEVTVNQDSKVATLKLNKTSLSKAKIIGATISKVTCKTKVPTTIVGPISVDIEEVSIPDATIENATVNEGAIVAANLAYKPTVSVEDPNISYAGDYFEFNVRVPGFMPIEGGDTVTAPAKSCFRVDNDPATAAKGDNKVSGKFVTKGEVSNLNIIKRYIILRDCKELTSPVETDVQYSIDKASMVAYDRRRFGWTYGALITPFKYYPGDKYFGGNATIGLYLGYRVHDRQGISDTLAFSLGATTASVTDAAGVTTNQSGTTLALAWLTEIKNKYVVGLIVGQDHFSTATSYLYNGKTWVGVNFGLKTD